MLDPKMQSLQLLGKKINNDIKLFFDMNSNVRKGLVNCVWLYKLCASTEPFGVQNFKKTAKNEKNNHYLQNSDYDN